MEYINVIFFIANMINTITTIIFTTQGTKQNATFMLRSLNLAHFS